MRPQNPKRKVNDLAITCLDFTDFCNISAIFRYCFGLCKAKDTLDVDKERFEQLRLQLPENWYLYTDQHQQGVQVEFPLRLKPILRFTPQNTATGIQLPIEELRIDFVKSPYSRV